MSIPYALFLPLLLAAPLTVTAQIVIESADMAGIGDAIVRYRDTLPAYGPGPAGPHQTWDFSNASTHATQNTQVMGPASTPFAGSFTGSNLAMTDDSGFFLYFNNGPAQMTATGIAGDFLGDGQNLAVPFNPVLTVHQFPRTYGSHFTDTYFFEVVADGAAFGVHSVRLRHHGTVYDTTDGHGQLITPIGTYDVLRAKTIGHNLDSMWYKLLAFLPWTFLQATRDTTESYSWLAKETKLAAAEMTLDSLGNPNRFTFTSIEPALPTTIHAPSAAPWVIAPQPARDGFWALPPPDLRTSVLHVQAADGRLWRVLPLNGGGRTWVPTTDWPPGAYVLRPHSAAGPASPVARVLVE